MWYIKKQVIFLIALVFLCMLGACSEFILEPQIIFRMSLDHQKLENENQVRLTLHSFNLTITGLEIIAVKVGDENIKDFMVIKEESLNQVFIEFPLPSNAVSESEILVGVDKAFYQAGFAVSELP